MWFDHVRIGTSQDQGCACHPSLSAQEVYNSRLRAARYFKGNLSHSELAKQAKAKLLADAAAANIQASYLPKRKSSNKDWSWVDQVEQQVRGWEMWLLPEHLASSSEVNTWSPPPPRAVAGLQRHHGWRASLL